MRILLFVLILMTAGCSESDFGLHGGNHSAPASNPADEVGGYPVPERCAEKDPVTRLCK